MTWPVVAAIVLVVFISIQTIYEARKQRFRSFDDSE